MKKKVMISGKAYAAISAVIIIVFGFILMMVPVVMPHKVPVAVEVTFNGQTVVYQVSEFLSHDGTYRFTTTNGDTFEVAKENASVTFEEGTRTVSEVVHDPAVWVYTLFSMVIVAFVAEWIWIINK